MTTLTLSATTRRVATGNGNFSREDAVALNQFPTSNSLHSSIPYDVTESIIALQETIKGKINAWYDNDGKDVLDIDDNEQIWTSMSVLTENVYDPIFASLHKPSTLCDVASVTAATFISLGSAIEEKLEIMCGSADNRGVLSRAADFSLSDNSPNNLTNVLLSNTTLSHIILKRLNEWLLDEPSDSLKILQRRARLMDAPLPHRYGLFEKFGGVRHETDSTNAAGTTNAADMHTKLVNHVLKVAFRTSGPRNNDNEVTHLQETHALSRFIIDFFYGSVYTAQRSLNTSVLYCDRCDYEAYQKLPEEYKRSSIIPGSYNMRDLPFRPFAVPSSYLSGNEFFKYDRAVSQTGVPLAFDFGEFMCHFVFGLEWDKHLGDVVDVLAHSAMRKFDKGDMEGVYLDANDYNRIGTTRMGVADLAMRSVAEFIRSQAYSIASGNSTVSSDSTTNIGLLKLKLLIQRTVLDIQHFIEDKLPGIVRLFKEALPEGDFGHDGEFECLVLHLFLSRLSDESHILRNADIQRTVHSTQIDLRPRTLTVVPTGTRIETYDNMEDVPSSVIDGLTGTATSTHNKGFYGESCVVSWDGASNRTVGVWRNLSLHPNTELSTTYLNVIREADKVKGVLRETSILGGLNRLFFNRADMYRALRARGIYNPGYNFTEYGRTFEDESNEATTSSIAVPLPSASAAISFGGVRSLFAEFRDVLETRAILTFSKETSIGFEDIMKTESEALSGASTLETQLANSLSVSFARDTSLGISFSEDTSALVINESKRTLLEETRALRDNTRSFSSVMEDLGVDVGKEMDDTFAVEMRDTFPDTAIREWDGAINEFEKSIPEVEMQKLDEIEKEVKNTTSGEVSLEGLSEKINDTKLAKATDEVVGKKLGNGFSMFMGRFGATVVIGSAVVGGFLGPATYGMMHASRGAHLNVVSNQANSGVVTYKMVQFSCEDKTLGWAKRATHPFREEIDTVIENGSFSLSEGAFVTNSDGRTSRFKAHAPICGEQDALISSCGSWATFDEPHSVLPWVANMKDLAKGTSVTCDKGMTASEAVVSSILSLGADVANKIFEVLEDTVVGIAERTFNSIINSPALIIGLPLVAGLASTRLKIGNWRTGLITMISVLVLILIVRFFAGSGSFTLNWFQTKDGAKREVTEAYSMDTPNFKRHKINMIPEASEHVQQMVIGDNLRPVFIPATTNHTKAARIIGRDVPVFKECFKQWAVAIQAPRVMLTSMTHVTPIIPTGFMMDVSGLDSFNPPVVTDISRISINNSSGVSDIIAANVKDMSLVMDAGITQYGDKVINVRKNTVVSSEVLISPRIHVIQNNTTIGSIDTSDISTTLERTLLLSVNKSGGGGGLYVNVFNTHAVDIAYLKIITAIGEFNPIGEIYIEVPPRTSSNNILTTNGEGRRVMVFCSWGGRHTQFTPSSFIFDIAKQLVRSEDMKATRLGVEGMLKGAISNTLDIPGVDRIEDTLHCIAVATSFAKVCGLDTSRISLEFYNSVLEAFTEQYDQDKHIHESDDNEVYVRDPPFDISEENGTVKLADMASNIGLFYYAPMMAKLLTV
uniref:Envelope protein n=1 Tax=Chionoecetes opilio bacilliform virus TaxID=1825681 RepID=A0A1Q3DLE6_9VIRU|nr:wsv011-like protein [Chionoecetes opilio bacilliform virus]GAV93153.1 envelope protein [Chionoecetes opilio bacilliform virus]